MAADGSTHARTASSGQGVGVPVRAVGQHADVADSKCACALCDVAGQLLHGIIEHVACGEVSLGLEDAATDFDVNAPTVPNW